MTFAGPSVLRVQPPITARQQMVLDFIVMNIKTRGFPPTMREIGEAFHIASTNGVSDHLRALERKGHITRDATRARGIRVLGLITPVPEPSQSRPAETARIIVDRLAVATALAELEALAEWVPGPIAARYEDALAELRAQVARDIPAPAQSSPEAA